MKELLTTGTRAALVAICLALGGVAPSLAASCDVCVVGGGAAGVAAALQAGRTAGAAAALAAHKKCDVRQVSLDELKSVLRATGPSCRAGSQTVGSFETR